MNPPKLIKSSKPRELIPNKPTEPRPKSCPNCNGRKIHAIEPITASGLAVWRCPGCRSIGYGQRCLGDPTSCGNLGAVASDGDYRHDLVK